MLELIGDLERHGPTDHAVLDTDIVSQRFVVLTLLQLGEAARKLAAPYKDAHPEVDWRGIIAFRNRLVHDYFRIRHDVVWNVLTQEIPSLKRELNRLLGEFDPLSNE